MEEDLQQAVIFTLGDADDSSVSELCRLLETAGAECVFVFSQKATPESKTYVGSGKAKEIADFCFANEITLAVCNDELTPSQIKNLEDIMDGVEVIDRSMLILEIFKKHAVTAEGKLQVEIAQLRYTIPRLIGKGAQLSRQGGGGGGGGGARRGAGETKLETDRRHVQSRIEYLKAQLDEMEKTRAVQRKSRERSGIPLVALAGYTNAGKSSLLNALTDAGILAEDKLFATLDTTTRKFTLPDSRQILLTDTVGFIQKLPHHLIKAFHSTLSEVAYADVILLVCDASDENCEMQLDVCEKLLSQLSAGDKPTVHVFNKWDCAIEEAKLCAASHPDSVRISALYRKGLDDLCESIMKALDASLVDCTLLIPHSESSALSRLYKEGAVTDCEYLAEGTKLKVKLTGELYGKYGKYTVKE